MQLSSICRRSLVRVVRQQQHSQILLLSLDSGCSRSFAAMPRPPKTALVEQVVDSAGYIWDPYEDLRLDHLTWSAYLKQRTRNIVGHIRTLFAAVTIGKKVKGFSAKRISNDLEDLYIAFIETYSMRDRQKLRELATSSLLTKLKKNLRHGGSKKGGGTLGFQVTGFHDNANLLQLRVLKATPGSKEPDFAQATILFNPNCKPVRYLRSGRVDPDFRLKPRSLALNVEEQWQRALDEDGNTHYRNAATGDIQDTKPAMYGQILTSVAPDQLDVYSISSVGVHEDKDGDGSSGTEEQELRVVQKIVFELPLKQSAPVWRVASF